MGLDKSPIYKSDICGTPSAYLIPAHLNISKILYFFDMGLIKKNDPNNIYKKGFLAWKKLAYKNQSSDLYL
jgi:hypothetical protein